MGININQLNFQFKLNRELEKSIYKLSEEERRKYYLELKREEEERKKKEEEDRLKKLKSD
jgi:hypothetical protein